MILLRRALVWLRDEYDRDRKQLLIRLLAAFLVCALVDTLVDLFFAMEGPANILRSLLLVPTSIAIFSLAYVASIATHKKRVEENPAWVPYRLRFSPSWRLRMGLITAAVLLVFAQAVPKDTGYTLSSSAIGACVIAIFAFLRRSNAEVAREELGIPDARDVIYDARKREFEREQARKKAAKKKKRQDRIGLKPAKKTTKSN